MTTGSETEAASHGRPIRLESDELPFVASDAGEQWADSPGAARRAEMVGLTNAQAEAFLHLGVRRGSVVNYYREALARGIPKKMARAIVEEAGRRLHQAHLNTVIAAADEEAADLLDAFKNSHLSGGGHLLAGMVVNVNPAEVADRERAARTRDRRERKEAKASDPHASAANPCDPKDYVARAFRGPLVTVRDLRPRLSSEPVALMQELAHAGA